MTCIFAPCRYYNGCTKHAENIEDCLIDCRYAEKVIFAKYCPLQPAQKPHTCTCGGCKK